MYFTSGQLRRFALSVQRLSRSAAVIPVQISNLAGLNGPPQSVKLNAVLISVGTWAESFAARTELFFAEQPSKQPFDQK